jgi:hypothetical protein
MSRSSLEVGASSIFAALLLFVSGCVIAGSTTDGQGALAFMDFVAMLWLGAWGIAAVIQQIFGNVRDAP